MSPDTFTSLDSQIIGVQGTEKYTDLDALYLTELFEYALDAKFDAYKTIQAWWLTELGFDNEAKQYTDLIVSVDAFDHLADICNTSTR